ncbi:hypothetical protein PLESTF_000331300 [Pleodorina starrii]|nr:hypothetical protein PLESTF_000331300 [Pleodorina starrii]
MRISVRSPGSAFEAYDNPFPDYYSSSSPSAAKAEAAPTNMDSQGRALFVLQYENGEALEALRREIVGGGGRLLSFVSESAVLVLARPDAVHSAGRNTDSLLASYVDEVKAAPEAYTIASASAALLDPVRFTAMLQQLDTWSRQPPLVQQQAAQQQQQQQQQQQPSQSGDQLDPWFREKSPPPPKRSNKSPLPSLPSGGEDGGGGVELYSLHVQVVPGMQEAELRATYQRRLAAALGRGRAGDVCWPQLRTYGESRWLHVFLCQQDLAPGVHWLTAEPTTTWVEPQSRASLANERGILLIQTGALSDAQYLSPMSYTKPFWKAGLTGRNQIIGLADTGINLNSCFLTDENFDYAREGAASQLLSGEPTGFRWPQHRKVVQYLVPSGANVSDYFGDYFQSHGTHVSGSIAGSMQDDWLPAGFAESVATGAAPLARLSFIDMVAQSRPGAMTEPAPFDQRHLPYHYAVGARISSDSWGYASASAAAYTAASQQYDSFAWRHPDFISCIAVGNNGRNFGMQNVQAPSTAKNVIAVGASVNHPSFRETNTDVVPVLQYTDRNQNLRSAAVWASSLPGTMDWLSFLSKPFKLPVVAATPLDGCGRLSTDGSPTFRGAVVVAAPPNPLCGEGLAAFLSSAREGGVLAVVLINPVPGEYLGQMSMPVLGSTDGLPVYLVTQAQGSWLLGVLLDTSNSGWGISNMRAYAGTEGLAEFSSYGPTADGRIKPDLVAPGQTVRSASSPNASLPVCTTQSAIAQGTSQATPMVAGHLALVRQYFTDGYYPQGWPTAPGSVRFNPSGMLLKATAIVGARSLEGGMAKATYQPMGPPPNGHQGWGRLDLSRTLPLPGSTPAVIRFQVVDWGTITTSQTFLLTGLRATGGGSVTAALVWHDYPGDPAAVQLLVNDLDLFYMINGDPTWRQNRPDSVNNVERLELSGLAPGDRITLVVHGSNIRHTQLGDSSPDAARPQYWALAVAGYFRGLLRSPLNPAFMRPQRLQSFAASAARQGPALSFRVRLPGGGCVVSGLEGRDAPAVQYARCDQPSAVLTFVETAGSDGGGPLYTYAVRDYLGRCLTVVPGGGPDVGILQMAACDGGAAQQMAVFQNPHSDSPLYRIAPRALLDAAAGRWSCLRAAASGDLLGLADCDDDDPQQDVGLVALPPVLLLHAEWYNGAEASTADLDVVVSWRDPESATLYTINPTAPATRGGLYGGDNTAVQPLPTNAEEVYWPYDQVIQPPDISSYAPTAAAIPATPAPKPQTTAPATPASPTPTHEPAAAIAPTSPTHRASLFRRCRHLVSPAAAAPAAARPLLVHAPATAATTAKSQIPAPASVNAARSTHRATATSTIPT